jgi:hypothetical protein
MTAAPSLWALILGPENLWSPREEAPATEKVIMSKGVHPRVFLILTYFV